MTAPDFFKWCRDRKVCNRGAFFIRSKSSGEMWSSCRRADWLCWVLDWVREPHPAKTQNFERKHWRLFLDGLYGPKAIKEIGHEKAFDIFVKWDAVARPTHDQALGCNGPYTSQFKWDWKKAEKYVRAWYPYDPLEGVEYVAFATADEYQPERIFPNDYL